MLDPDTMDLLKWGFFLGVGYSLFRQKSKDVDGVGMKQRAMEMKLARQRRNEIADEIEKLCPNKQGKQLAKKLRED
jgi:hypothetical protein